MERTKLLTFAVIGLLLLNLITLGFLILKPGQFPKTDPSHGGPHPAGQEPAWVIIDRLHFDEQQQRQYLAMAHRHHQQTEQLLEKSVRLFQTYYNLLPSAHPDSVQARTLVQQIADVQRQIAELNFSHFQQIKALCRPDQQTDFNRLVVDLSRLFGKPQRHPGTGHDGPPKDHLDGPTENFPSHP